MKTTYYIKNSQPKVPITFPIVIYLLLDNLKAPEWIWAVSITLLVLLYIVLIINVIYSEKVNILDENGNIITPKNENKIQKSFDERLDELAKKRGINPKDNE